MTPPKIITPSTVIGWKVNAVGVASILLGLLAVVQKYYGEGIKGVMFGLALISLRDTLGKILAAIDSARIALSDLRAAIETSLSRKAEP
jgi:hypothetical protein